MLSLHHNQQTAEVCLLIETDLAQAWISYYPPAYLPRDGPDWRLRVRLAPHEPVLGRRTQTGLMIESHLRAWLLQRFRRRLRDLRFAELRQIAERKPLAPIESSRLLERKRIFKRHLYT